MKSTRMRRVKGTFWKALLAVIMGLITVTHGWADASELDAIMELARAGRNREAIEAFEELPEDGGPYPLSVLRAVAGCYWREREFEAARELYNEILQRRPTLQGLVPEGAAPSEREIPVEPEPAETVSQPVVDEAEVVDEVAETEPEARDDDAEEAPVAVVTDPPKEVEPADVDAAVVDEPEALEPEDDAVADATDVPEVEEAEAETDEPETAAVEDEEDRVAEESPEPVAAEDKAEVAVAVVPDVADAPEEPAVPVIEEKGMPIADVAPVDPVAEPALETEPVPLEVAAPEATPEPTVEPELDEIAETVEEPETDAPDHAPDTDAIDVVARGVEPELTGGLDRVLDALRREYMEIEARASAREQDLRDRMKALQAETEQAVSQADGLQHTLEAERDRRLEIEAEREAREAKLAAQAEALESKLASVGAELEAAREYLARAEDEQVEADAARVAEREALEARIAELAEASAKMYDQVDGVRAELEREREMTRELRAWRETREEEFAREVETLTTTAIERALQEIEQLEAEHARLEEAASVRQAELEAKIAMLSERSSESREAKTKLAEELMRERDRRVKLEARDAEREKELEEAQYALRAVSTSVLEQLERIYNALVAHQTELRISHERERELADMAPVLNQLEAAASEAAEETARLRLRISEQEADFEAQRQAYRETIAGLEARVGTLSERNDRLAAELRDTQAALVKAEAAAGRLREQLDVFEAAFSSPDGTFDPDLLSGMDRVFATIARTAGAHPDQAVQQFERLPDVAEMPVSLLKTMAGIYRERRDFDSARALYERVLAIQPGDLQTERRLVMTLFDMGRYDEALKVMGGSPATAADK